MLILHRISKGKNAKKEDGKSSFPKFLKNRFIENLFSNIFGYGPREQVLRHSIVLQVDLWNKLHFEFYDANTVLLAFFSPWLKIYIFDDFHLFIMKNGLFFQKAPRKLHRINFLTILTTLKL